MEAELRRELLLAQALLGRHEEVERTLLDFARHDTTDDTQRALDDTAIGGAYLRLERFEQAVTPLRRAVTTFDRQGDTYRAAWAMHGLAHALDYSRQDLAAALTLRQDLHARLERAFAPTLHRANLTELGFTCMRLRRYDDAHDWLTRAEAYETHSGETATSTHRLLAELYWTLGAYDACEHAARRALAHPDPRDRGAFFPLLQLGRLHARRGQPDLARSAYARLTDELDAFDVPYVRGQLLLALSDVSASDEAESLASRALNVARDTGEAELETAALATLAHALLKLGRPHEALQSSTRAAERLDRHAPFDDPERPSLVHHDVLLALGEPGSPDVLRDATRRLDALATRVPLAYREAFLTRHHTNGELRRRALAARIL